MIEQKLHPAQEVVETEATSIFKELLEKPSTIGEYPSIEDQEKFHDEENERLRASIVARQAEMVKNTTSGGKLRVLKFWYACHLRAYVVERRGKGILVQADDVQVWLPSNHVYVLDECTIDLPDWLVRRRSEQFDVFDCREGSRSTLSWNSSNGDYHGN